MKVIGIGLQKGGVGKTSITLALASELAKKYRVLIVDADPQGNATCGILNEVHEELAGVLMGDYTVEKAITQSPQNENIFILPTLPINTKLRAYKASGDVSDDRYLIEDTLKKVSAIFDFCLIDTSPDFSTFEKNCFWACDEIVPVMNCDAFASDGLTIFLDNIQKFCAKVRKENLKINTIVMNKYNRSLKLDTEIKTFIEEQKTYRYVTIPQDQSFKVCQSVQKLLNGKPDTMKSIKELADYVAK